MVMPGRNIQVKPLLQKIVTASVIDRRAQQIAQTYSPAGDVRKREFDVALALIWRIVYGNQQTLVTIVPRKTKKTIGCPVPIPRGAAVQQPPFTIAHDVS